MTADSAFLVRGRADFSFGLGDSSLRIFLASSSPGWGSQCAHAVSTSAVEVEGNGTVDADVDGTWLWTTHPAADVDGVGSADADVDDGDATGPSEVCSTSDDTDVDGTWVWTTPPAKLELESGKKLN